MQWASRVEASVADRAPATGTNAAIQAQFAEKLAFCSCLRKVIDPTPPVIQVLLAGHSALLAVITRCQIDGDVVAIGPLEWELTMALRTRLRISREADSDGPTTWKLGSPEVRWTSTVTAGASRPAWLRVLINAMCIDHP